MSASPVAAYLSSLSKALAAISGDACSSNWQSRPIDSMSLALTPRLPQVQPVAVTLKQPGQSADFSLTDF